MSKYKNLPKKDFLKKSKETEETLRGENRRLIKEIKRLRNRLNKKERLSTEEDVWEKYPIEELKIEPLKNYTCPKCKSNDVTDMELRHKIYIFCQDCNYRGPLSD